MTTTLHDDGITRRVPSSVGDPVDYARVTMELLRGAGEGATVGVTGTPYGGNGILVAVPEHGEVLWNDDDPAGRPVGVYIYEWVNRVARAVTSRADYFFGAWADGDGYLYLDVVQAFSDEDRDAALRAGRVRLQKAVYDAGREQVIYL